MITENIFLETMGAKILPASHSESLFDLELNKINSLFKEKNLLLFRGFNANENDFIHFSELIGDNFLTYQGGAYERQMIAGKNSLLSVTGFSQKNLVPLHGEMYYKRNKPKLLWFYCDTAPARGGQTTVCDAKVFYESLSRKTKDFFNNSQITYIRHYTPEKWKTIFKIETLQELFEIGKEEGLEILVKQGDHVETRYTCSAILKDEAGFCYFINNIMPIVLQQFFGKGDVKLKLDNGDKIPLKIVFELFWIARKKTCYIGWEKGDIVLINNHKLLHGRTKIKDLNRNIYVRMSQSKMGGN